MRTAHGPLVRSRRNWDRASFDLDQPFGIAALLDDVRPDRVIHAAAWTDVDACARDPELAIVRNATATHVLASACAARDVALTVVSTNEVFDGQRTDQRPYGIGEQTSPANPYGHSKREGEHLAAEAFESMPGRLTITRTAWLFGPGKPDFPERIAAAARQALSEGRPLRVVADEVGTPTYVVDVARAVVQAANLAMSGVVHLVNAGTASRADWACDVAGRLEIPVVIEDIALGEYQRPSRPPRWGVLETTPVPGAPMQHWREAMVDRVAAGGPGG